MTGLITALITVCMQCEQTWLGDNAISKNRKLKQTMKTYLIWSYNRFVTPAHIPKIKQIGFIIQICVDVMLLT